MERLYFLRLICFILLFFPWCAVAQSLPNKQEVSLRSPNNLKVDGRADEWSNVFQAHNSATNIYYSISNNQTELVLIIRVIDPLTIEKVVSSGISFTIKRHKNEKDIVVVTYPNFNRTMKPNFDLKSYQTAKKVDKIHVGDSLMRVNNGKIEGMAKWINVHGLSGIDSVLSIYNDEGIRAAALFDNETHYTYELAISLDLLQLSAEKADKFSYNIRLNEITKDNVNGITITPGKNNEPPYVSFSKGFIAPNSNPLAFNAPVDFWGEYTLANKP